MRALFDGIPLAQMNTSMTINATAMWLLALYQVVAEEQGADPAALAGTTQNDIVKEYLSRGTYVFPPGPSLRLTTDLVSYAVTELPGWNPINICSYHLQEAGATPVQEVAFSLCTAIAVLDAVQAAGQVPPSASARRAAGSASSSTRGCASSRRCARCAPSRSCGTRCCRSGTACRTRGTGASGTGCRSTRWA
jgi:(2R)-ethylmalonyl-CoA mutase